MTLLGMAQREQLQWMLAAMRQERKAIFDSVASIDDKIKSIEALLAGPLDDDGAAVPHTGVPFVLGARAFDEMSAAPKPRRQMSEDARKRIGDAARKRWANARKGGKTK